MIKKTISVLAVLLILALLAGCTNPQGSTAGDTTAPAASESSQSSDSGTSGFNFKEPVDPNEVYHYVSILVNYPMLVEHDQRGWKMACEELGVTAQISGPAEFDIPATIAAIETAAAQKPAGMGLLGNDKSYKSAIDKAVDAGIPFICVDTDVPESKRLAFIGTDWAQIGKQQGLAMVELIGGKGKVAAIGQIGNASMIMAFEEFKKVLAEYPDIQYLGESDSQGNEAEVARVTADLIRANPDIAGIGCFDAASAPGVAVAVKEANKVGAIKVTTVDIEPGQLSAIKDGVVQFAVGQKRELFTYYGVLTLFILNHSAMDFGKADNERVLDILPIPSNIDTGLIYVNEDNKDAFIKKMEENMGG